ncbi:MAG: acyl carrier protein [Acidobacteria bacterium]|nr:acyl carrier protein [Acidobacteriota bacterium]
MPESILERVIRVIASAQHMPPEEIHPGSTFEELGIDSLDGINIVFALENEFDVNIPDEAAKSIRGVGDIVQGIDKLLAEKQGPSG